MGETFSALIIWTASKFSVPLWRPAARAQLRACSDATHKLTMFIAAVCILFLSGVFTSFIYP